jgi:hypothetical protein
MNSLRYMFWLCAAFAIASFLSMIWEITRYYPTAELIWRHLLVLGPLQLLLWSLPFLAGLRGILLAVETWRKRLQDYLDFSSGSPGPGVRLKTDRMRHVTFDPIEGYHAPELESDPHAQRLARLRGRSQRLARLVWLAWAIAVIPTVVAAIVVLFKLR